MGFPTRWKLTQGGPARARGRIFNWIPLKSTILDHFTSFSAPKTRVVWPLSGGSSAESNYIIILSRIGGALSFCARVLAGDGVEGRGLGRQSGFVRGRDLG